MRMVHNIFSLVVLPVASFSRTLILLSIESGTVKSSKDMSSYNSQSWISLNQGEQNKRYVQTYNSSFPVIIYSLVSESVWSPTKNNSTHFIGHYDRSFYSINNSNIN